MKIRNLFVTAALLGLLTACSLPHSEMKSPCAGIAGSPCGPHRPVNDWWMNSAAQDENS
jgi:hypothetical protein